MARAVLAAANSVMAVLNAELALAIAPLVLLSMALLRLFLAGGCSVRHLGSMVMRPLPE